MKKDKKKDLLEALEKNLGIVTAACREVGISRETYYRWLREDEEFKFKAEDIDNIAIDYVEHQLYNKIKEGSERSILFYMKYKGGKRGYSSTSSQEITHKGTLPLFPDVDYDDNDDNNNEKEDDED